MAELNIGEHCAKPDCKQLDFLPIQCDACKLIFCKLHSSTTAHDCAAVIGNPVTPTHVVVGSENRCACQFAGCSKNELVPLICEACEGMFCVSHKQKETHQCPKLWTATDEANAEREAGLAKASHLDRSALKSVSRPLHGAPSEPASAAPASKPVVVSARARATAARLTLMQAKMHAKPAGRAAASLSQEDRFVLRLTAANELGPSTTEVAPFFVGKNWPLGRVLDFAQEYFAVKKPATGAHLALVQLLDDDDDDQAGDKVRNTLDLSQTVGDYVKNGELQEACLLQLIQKN